MEKSLVYIKENYSQWNFKTIIQECEIPSSQKIKFVFIFKFPDDPFSLAIFGGEGMYICTDGYIRNLGSAFDKDCFCVYNRELAIELSDKLQQKVSFFLRENNLQELESYESCFSIKPIKSGKPTHLFTKQEIAEEMRKADDGFDNQLVIDEDGYAKVISDHQYGYLYPVKYKVWIKDNLYVGVDSELSTLEDDYISLLQGWLHYLKNEQNLNASYIQVNKNEEELIEEIKKYY